MIVDTSGRVFALSTDLQPVPTAGGTKDAFVEALTATANTGALVQRLIKVVTHEVSTWSDRLMQWQRWYDNELHERRLASAGALGSPTDSVVGASSLPTTAHTLPLPLGYAAASPKQSQDLAFLRANQWVLLRDFLISCCDPVCRTEVLNEYRLSSSSLSAAAAEGRYSVDDIRTVIIYFVVVSANRSLITGEGSASCTNIQHSHLQIYASSPLAAFDAVIQSLLTGPTGSHVNATSNKGPRQIISMFQRFVLVRSDGHSVPVDRKAPLAAALALSTLFVPRPIETALHAQGEDGRLKIVLKRKVGLWHPLLAEDEARSGRGRSDPHTVTNGYASPHDNLRQQIAAAGRKFNQSAEASEADTNPPLRNYLCCASRSHLEYCVTQMRYLFTPVLLASLSDLQPEDAGAFKAEEMRPDWEVKDEQGDGDEVEIDMDDLFGREEADTQGGSAAHPRGISSGPNAGMATLVARLGGKVLPQMVFSDVEEKRGKSEQRDDSTGVATIAKTFGVHNHELFGRRLSGILSAAPTINASTQPAARNALQAQPAGPAQIIYCAEIKPNALRELRAILHDQHRTNVDCYFDFLSEEESATSARAEDTERGEAAVRNFKLKPGVALRPYQKASLERFCQEERTIFAEASSAGDDGNADEDEGGDNAESEVVKQRKARAKEDAYNAALTGGAATLFTGAAANGLVVPPPARRIAHHGIVVLPCGAGKTLTGIAASAMVGRRTIVMCINVLSVLQWRDQFMKWTCLRPDQVTVCTRDLKQLPSDVFITTYSMLTAQQPAAHHYKRRRKPGAAISNEPPIETEGSILKKAIMKEIRETAWGMLVLDEVHVAPASCFQTVVDKVKYHCILGLSATLLREDMGIDKLRYLVGPKLYEANWLELTRAGNLAPVMCAEVRCPLPPAMLRQYLMHLGGFAEGARQALKLEKQRARQGEDDGSDGDANHISSRRMRVDIECINPNKLWCTQALVAFHESRTPPDKTIIFCDSVPAAHYYARKLGIAFMDRSASDTERSHMLKYFQHSPHLNTIILTRVGDIALDLPEATVVIQISGLFASQRQEAQRLGRILRPKPPSLDHGTSFFYSLVSEDTAEVEAAGNRQAWLRDQGYSYRILRCDEIIKYYTDNRKGFVSSSLPADELHRPSAQSPIGAMGNSSPFSRPLVCVGRPTWHYRVPIHVTYAAGRKNGGHVLRLGKRSREDEDGAMTSVRSEGPTTTIRWIWIPFSHSNSLMIEKAFAAGHYNRDPKLHLNKVAQASGDGPSHPPLLLGDGELVPIGSVKRATGCDTEYSALTTFQSCPGTATAPFRDHFHQYLDSTSPGNKALTSNGRKGKKQAELVATAKKLSAAADGSAGYVYFDTSDLPSSHGEWTVSVREGGTIQDANTKAKGSASDITESTPLSQILGVLAPDEQKVPKGKGQQSTVFKLRIRRGRGPLEAPERLDGGGVGHCDLEGECSQEWNESFAFGTSAYDGNTPDEHDCRAEPGSGQPNRIVDRLRVSEKYQRDPLTCVQHFTHVELGKRADGDFQKSSYKKKN